MKKDLAMACHIPPLERGNSINQPQSHPIPEFLKWDGLTRMKALAFPKGFTSRWTASYTTNLSTLCRHYYGVDTHRSVAETAIILD